MEIKYIYRSKVQGVLLVFFAILYITSFIFWRESADLYYWYNRAEYCEDEFMNAFSMLIGKGWKYLVGDSIVLWRLLTVVVCVISVSVPYFCLQSREQIRKNLCWLALGIFFFGSNTHFYSSDHPTMFFMACLGTYIIRYGFNSYYKIAVAAILSAIVASCRFPNILVIPFLCLLLIYDCYNKKLKFSNGIYSLLVYFSVSVISYFLLTFLIIGDANIFLVIKESFVLAQQQSPSHGLFFLFNCHIHSFFNGIVPFAFALFLIYLYSFLGIKDTTWWGIKLVACCFMFYCLQHIVKNATSQFYVAPWREAFYYAMILIMVYNYKKKHSYESLLFCIVVTGLAYISSAGSDNALSKAFLTSVSFSPLILVTFKDKLSASKLYYWYLGTILIYAFCTYSYQTWEHTNRVKYDKFEMQYVNDTMYDGYVNHVNDYNRYGKKDHCVFYGVEYAQFMYAATNSKMLYLSSFWNYQDNEYEINTIIDIMSHDHSVVLFEYYKEPSLLLYEKAHEIGYSLVQNLPYRYVYKYEED